MKILFCAVELDMGGFSSYIKNMSNELRARGHYVCVYLTEPYGVMFNEVRCAVDEVRVRRRFLQSQNRFLNEIVSDISAIAPDVVINNANVYVQAAFPFLDPRVVCISVVHNVIDYEVNLALGCNWAEDHILAVSENIAEKLRELCLQRSIDCGKISVVPVGVPTPSYIERPHSFTGGLRLISVGRLVPQKNIAGLVSIIEKVLECESSASVVIIGDGCERPRVEELVKLSKGRVEYLGFLRPDAISRAFENADIFLMTSFFEGTPHALLEAMGAGVVPVVAKIEGSVSDIVKHGVGGFLCENSDYSSFVRNIAHLSRERSMLRAMSEQCRHLVRSKYSVVQRVDTILALVKERRQEVSRQAPSSIVMDKQLRPLARGTVRQLWHRLGDIAKWILHRRRAEDCNHVTLHSSGK